MQLAPCLKHPFQPALALLLATQLLQGGPITREDILLAHWKLDESVGDNASDSTANKKDGTLRNMGDASWVPGKFGNALVFDGKDDFVDLPTDIGLTSAKGTVALWLKTARDATDHGFAYYASSATGGDGFGTQNEYHIGLRNNEQINFWVRPHLPPTSRAQKQTPTKMASRTYSNTPSVENPPPRTAPSPCPPLNKLAASSPSPSTVSRAPRTPV